MNRFTSIVTIISIVFVGCSPKPKIESEEEGCAPSENEFIPDVWREEGITKVVGYRFKIPGENAKGQDSTGYFTLCWDDTVDLEALDRIKTGSAELNAAQVRTLLDCVFSDGEPLWNVACYSPHQIFIFYDAEGKAKRAIEVCFLCNGVHAIPPIPKDQYRRHDLIRLARLCDELGIWSDYTLIEDYVPLGFKPEAEDDKGEQGASPTANRTQSRRGVRMDR